MYDKTLKSEGSIRNAAKKLSLTKSKFMVLWKRELGLCTATTGCKESPKTGKTRCEQHLRYASKTQDKERQKQTFQIWRKNNTEHRRSYNLEYQRKNRDLVNACNRKYSKSDKGKIVNRAKRAYRRAMQKQATPLWLDKTAMKAIYAACPKGFHVDHIIPLENDLVCGLHVPWNLQYLSGFENDSKGNKFDGTYENLAWKQL